MPIIALQKIHQIIHVRPGALAGRLQFIVTIRVKYHMSVSCVNQIPSEEHRDEALEILASEE